MWSLYLRGGGCAERLPLLVVFFAPASRCVCGIACNPQTAARSVITRKPSHTIRPDIRADARTSSSSTLEKTLLQFEIVL
jgi:hypothetical protein